MATGRSLQPLSRDYLRYPVITGENRTFFFYQEIESSWPRGGTIMPYRQNGLVGDEGIEPPTISV